MDPRGQELPRAPITGLNNPYKAQRLWPPDFSKMNSKEQFRLEKKYRRRAKLAYTRPKWQNGVKLTQYTSIMVVLGYAVFFMDWKDVPQPFERAREWIKHPFESLKRERAAQSKPDLGRIQDQERAQK